VAENGQTEVLFSVWLKERRKTRPRARDVNSGPLEYEAWVTTERDGRL
jgi:hypothetical protein